MVYRSKSLIYKPITQLTPAARVNGNIPHTIVDMDHLGTPFNISSFAGTMWRAFPKGSLDGTEWRVPDYQREELPRFPREFRGTTMPITGMLVEDPNLASCLSPGLFDLAVRARHW